MKLIIISDIHANLTALNSVLKHVDNNYGADVSFVNLGDVINYGVRPNEVIDVLKYIKEKTIVSLQGNHEAALFGNGIEKFSSERGKQALFYTKKLLSESSISFLSENFNSSSKELKINNKKFLFVHANISDNDWGRMDEIEIQKPIYNKFDFVIFGHSHKPLFFEKVNINRTKRMELKKTIFINPGSVGQPRNGNPASQYVYLDSISEEIYFHKVKYKIEEETRLYKNSEFNEFYSKRLQIGI